MNAVLCWLTQSLADVPDGDSWLSGGERNILSTLRSAKRRNDWRLGRWTAKQAVCAYQLKEDPLLSSLEIRTAPDGAPEAYWNDGCGKVSVSISHSNDRSLCIVGPPDFAIGCDLERLESREDTLIQDYFLPEEISFCRQAPAEEKHLAANLVWSAKETILKAVREGLRRDTRSVLIDAHWGKPENTWNTWTGHCLQSSRAFYGWWRTGEGYVYTLACDRPTSVPEQLWAKPSIRFHKF